MLTGIPQECSALVEFQHGVIARWQAPRVGLRPAAIDGLLRSGRWRQLYRGVYAAYTGRPPRDAQLWAAALRCGPGAALSHHTAAELDGLTDRRQEVIHVTVGRDRRIRNPAGERRHELAPRIVLHRTDRIDAIRHPAKAPPRTRVAETVLDLTQLSLTFDEAFSWLSRGCGRRLVTPQLIRTAVTTRRRVRWRDEILAALPLIADGVHSNLEFRYVSDVERPIAFQSRPGRRGWSRKRHSRGRATSTTCTSRSEWAWNSTAARRIWSKIAGRTFTGITSAPGWASSSCASAGPM